MKPLSSRDLGQQLFCETMPWSGRSAGLRWWRPGLQLNQCTPAQWRNLSPDTAVCNHSGQVKSDENLPCKHFNVKSGCLWQQAQGPPCLLSVSGNLSQQEDARKTGEQNGRPFWVQPCYKIQSPIIERPWPSEWGRLHLRSGSITAHSGDAGQVISLSWLLVSSPRTWGEKYSHLPPRIVVRIKVTLGKNARHEVNFA